MTSSTSYSRAYQSLNPEQKLAVDTIDGPLLVLAGPGTGKTQLLSARVCNILRLTDTTASNILCLTFTESAAANIRERLRSFIGEEAYNVTISTYHSFGSDIIKNYAEYFQQIYVDRTDDIRLERPIDELTQIQLVERLIDQLPFDSQLLDARYYIGSVVETISNLKQSLISPTKLKSIAKSNLVQIDSAQEIIDTIVNQVGGISLKKTIRNNQYSNLLSQLSTLKGSLIELALNDLKHACDESVELNSSKPLTIWKNTWLYKNERDYFTLTKRSTSERMLELANLYELYEKSLRAESLYDFDDMILRVIEGITNNATLRFNLQERYQYILLDEFQDTNPAQFELVKKICDHPVHEGRPNVMAVGDDDQAIYAFQGASVGNLQDFINTFRDVAVINLTHNYRSHKDILHVAKNIAEQINSRIHKQLKNIDKVLQVANKLLPAQSTIIRQELLSEASEYAWVAEQISTLITKGVNPAEISVLAPKHAILENLVPFLKQKNIPVSYEKRENILETEIIQGLLLSAQLLAALHDQDMAKANEYFPQVLSLSYWQIPALEIWKINWQHLKHVDTRSWAEQALNNPALAPAVQFYLSLSHSYATDPLEIMLDKLTGTQSVDDGNTKLISPLKQYYFAEDNHKDNATQYYETIKHLSVIRSHLRAYQEGSDHQLKLSDFLNFYTMYHSAGAVLTDSYPVSQNVLSVKLMTVYKAKGLEFDHVFILQAHDDVWGSSSRGSNNQLALPPNLSYIRYVGSGDDERLRLFFVAVTRARHGLYISSHATKDNGKSTTPLKYLNEANGISTHLPPASQNILKNSSLEHISNVETLWSASHIKLPINLHNLLVDQLANYVMSPTHLNTFMDLEYGGPEEFLFRTLLRFPSAPTPKSEYGVAIHKTLEWYQLQISSGHTPTINQTLAQYEQELQHRYLDIHERNNLLSRGRVVIEKYLTARQSMFQVPASVEVNFFGDGIVLGDARLTGKIDRLEVDKETKSLRIVDFKTGKPLIKWDATMNAYKYKHQLYFYKFLLQNSYRWKEYTITDARLEFVEPQDLKNGEIQPPLIINFNKTEEDQIKHLIQVVWNKIQKLDFPPISKYSKNVSGSKSFEHDLLI